MATSSSSSSSKASSISPHRPSSLFTPIEEGNEEDEYSQGGRSSSFRGTTPPSEQYHHHHPTPLHSQKSGGGGGAKKCRPENDESVGVLCNKCRPSNREKISVVPLENGGGGGGGGAAHRLSITSPNGLFRSILASLKKSPKSSSDGGSIVSGGDDHWKIVVAELSNKLVQATRKRDEAILESSKLKNSMAELERKLNKLEIYCHTLKSNLQGFNNASQNNNHTASPSRSLNYAGVKVGDQQKVIHHFLILISEARSSVRLLTRALALQLRQMSGNKVHDRISLLLQPYDVKISFAKNPRASLLYLEALINRAFYEDFESIGFHKSSPHPVLNPIDRCEANFAMFSRLQELTWEEVLNKGTRHFSEEFSRFCDRKMSEIVGMLGWNRAWPEALLQSFFGASKAVWLVHLLANSVHPSLPIFRVDKAVGFDPVYMEDMGGDRAKRLVPTMVRIMVTPGFYVYDNVVKCKVTCRYCSSFTQNHHQHQQDQRFSPTPSR